MPNSGLVQSTIRYILTTYTTITYEDLNWRDFVDIFALINTSVLTHEYGLHKYL